MSVRAQDPEHPQNDPTQSNDDERGAALILVIIVTVLLYALIWQLVRDGQTARILSDNDLLQTRMRYHVRYTLEQVEDQLIQDGESAAAGEEEGGGGGLGGLAGALGGGEGGAPGGEGGEGEEEEPDPSTIADGSQDAWFQPTAYTDDDITTYAFVEDENRKFNILSILSRDEEFAKESRERLVRLLDNLREDTDFDLSLSDAELIVSQLEEWTTEGGRSEWLPRPPLRSDSEENDRQDLTIPLTLDELMLLPRSGDVQVTEELFYDKPWEGRTLLGLESVLTVYTNLAYDPGTPEQSGQGTGAPAGAAPGGQAGGEQGGGEQPNAGTPGQGQGSEGPVDPESLSPIGQGIRININTAPRPVLRALFDRNVISDEVIDAIIEWRNTETEESGEELTEELTTFVQEGVDQTFQMFTDLEQLEEIEEFANIPDTDVKEQFKALLTVTSDVFSIHFASIQVRDEESRAYVMQRSRSIVVRIDGDDGMICHPLVRFERRHGLRLMPVDDLEDFDLGDQSNRNREMDAFSQEERAWNPFLLDFYRPPDEREELYDYTERYR